MKGTGMKKCRLIFYHVHVRDSCLLNRSFVYVCITLVSLPKVDNDNRTMLSLAQRT
jgi:hypothetical protein